MVDGGVKAPWGINSIGLIDNWIRHIKDSYRFHKEELDSIGEKRSVSIALWN